MLWPRPVASRRADDDEGAGLSYYDEDDYDPERDDWNHNSKVLSVIEYLAYHGKNMMIRGERLNGRDPGIEPRTTTRDGTKLYSFDELPDTVLEELIIEWIKRREVPR